MRSFSNKKERKKRKLEKFVVKYFPTTHHKEDQSNCNDDRMKKELDLIEVIVNKAAKLTSRSILKKAISRYEVILSKKNITPRALNQKAEALSLLYYMEGSYILFRSALTTFYAVMDFPGVPMTQFKVLVGKCLYLLQDQGYYSEASFIQSKLVSLLPNDTDALNTLGGIFWIAGEPLEAKKTFSKALELNPSDPFSSVYLGYIFYYEALEFPPVAGNNVKSVDLFRKASNLLTSGIQSKNAKVMNGNFYYAQGDTYRRLHMPEEADKVFLSGVKDKLFPSFWQRSVYNFNGIESKPLWTKKDIIDTYMFDLVQNKWKSIRMEALKIFNSNLYVNHNEKIKDIGSWEIFVLYANGKKNIKNCLSAPITCQIIDRFPQISLNRKGSVKFSMMASGTHVHTHSGSCNCRLRAHLGLDVPSTNTSFAAGSPSRLRVLNEYITWRNGELFVFDDSFDHEVWHYNSENLPRLILILDMWHPALNQNQLSNI